jgi:hypothetical protein
MADALVISRYFEMNLGAGAVRRRRLVRKPTGRDRENGCRSAQPGGERELELRGTGQVQQQVELPVAIDGFTNW